MKNLIFILLLSANLNAFSQLTENFNDGKFRGTSSNPRSTEWSGDADRFIVNADNQLQLFVDEALSPAQLRTASTIAGNGYWEFWSKLDFNPTSSNYAKIYLFGDEDDLSGETNGIFVRLGYTNKNISLVQSRKGSTNKTLINGAEKRIDLPSVDVKIKVTFDKSGKCTLFSKLDGETDYVEEGSCQIDDELSGKVFGVVCYFTKTRGKHFFFDDLTARQLRDDEQGIYSGFKGEIDVTYPEFAADNYVIHYRLDKPGYNCQAMLYDSQGRMVSVLANNEKLASSEGELRWNGKGSSNRSLTSGIYIIYMEVYDTSGVVKKFKKTVVVK